MSNGTDSGSADERAPLSRAQEIRLIYKHTHRDYRSMTNGKRSVLYLDKERGTCLSPIEALPEDVYAEKLRYALSREAASKRKEGRQ